MSSEENISKSQDAPKDKPKAIRVLTVMAYVLSVSMAAILLSIYYIFMWQGRPHLGAQHIGDIGCPPPFKNCTYNVTSIQKFIPRYEKLISEDQLQQNITEAVIQPISTELSSEINRASTSNTSSAEPEPTPISPTNHKSTFNNTRNHDVV
ncbi:uncharacterized protein LOC115887283 isoform X2 [Sitophilus oryzae]|uniref:Uncharacterized protein LOC115887283 isoform X2 n=1 Tax=Sitophilus oryzae TaxID=7048 RepID=A0A6J2YGX4_SITOR|nr:uncharacterized protein LOC115887283 isoform X2 [Sitophilus oryzae]